MKKKIIILVMAMAMATSFTACGGPIEPQKIEQSASAAANTQAPAVSDNKDSKEKDKDAEDSSTAAEDSAESGIDTSLKSYAAAEKLAAALENEDYDALLELCRLPGVSVVNADDVRYWANRSDFADLLGKEVKITELSEKRSAGAAAATLKAGKYTAEASFALSEDADEWELSADGLAYENIDFNCPADAKATLNGVELDPSTATAAISAGSGGYSLDYYTVTAPKRAMKAVIATDAFGELTADVTLTDDGQLICFPDVPKEVREQAYKEMIASMNAVLALEDGADASAFFSEKCSYDEVKAMSDMIRYDFTATYQSVEPREDALEAAVVGTNEFLFNVQVNWIDNGFGHSHKKNAGGFLSYENGAWKLSYYLA